jgi:hypothetical protein
MATEVPYNEIEEQLGRFALYVVTGVPEHIEINEETKEILRKKVQEQTTENLLWIRDKQLSRYMDWGGLGVKKNTPEWICELGETIELELMKRGKVRALL